MAVLTKEYFDQQFKRLVTQEDFEDRLKKGLEEGFEKQAVMIKNGFDATATKADLEEVRKELKGDIQSVETKVQGIETRLEKVETGLERVEIKLDRALHTEYVNLEVRVNRIEQKIGLKPLSESV